MKIERIIADNFLQLRMLDVDLSGATTHLFAGDNEAGKTSLQEAIRFAARGEVARVTRKSDYKMMVRDGAKNGSVTVQIDGQVLKRNVKDAKLDGYEPEFPDALPLLLDAQRFAKLKDGERRAFLLALTNTSVKGPDIAKRMKIKGVSDECIETVLPMLRSGFDATHKEAKDRAAEARAQWKGLTGEVYGSVKAETWEATPPEGLDPEALKEGEARLAELREEISNLQLTKGGIANQIDQAKTETPIVCCACACEMRVRYERDPITGKNLPVTVPFERQEEVDTGPLMARLHEISAQIDKLQGEQANLYPTVQGLIAKQLMAENLKSTTERAQGFHHQVGAWEKCAETLAPDGIPGEILSDALTPVNNRLRETAQTTGWPQITIEADMSIRADGRLYQLLSESAQWRADAALAEAIAHLSGLKLLILDRIDVLSVPNRGALLTWINGIQAEYDTILLFGTLKELPAKLPPGWAGYWLHKGEIASTTAQEAA